jgi:hypothetical protein
VLEDIRSESLRLVQGSAEIRNCTTVPWAQPWFTYNGGSYLARRGSYKTELLTGTSIGGDGITYRVASAPTGAVFGGLAPPVTATSTSPGPPATVTVQGANWTPDEFAGYRLSVQSATHGSREYGIIAGNTADTITLKDLGGGVYYTTYAVPQVLYPDFQMVNPSGNVTFVVEPDWGKQFSCTVKGLTTQWEEFPFYTEDGAGGARFNGSIDGLNSYGTLRSGASHIHNLWVSRQDWARDATGCTSSPTWDDWEGIHVRGGDVPWTFPANGPPITFPSASVEQKGSEWIVWNRASFGGGPRYPTLGIGPGDDAFGEPTAADPNYLANKDILAFWGKLGRQTPTDANQAGQPMQIVGGISTGSGSPGAVEFWFGKTGVPGRQVNGPATRQAMIDASGLTLGSGAGSSAIGAAPSHGQSLQILAGEELVTVAAAESTRTAMQLPAGAVVYAISVRVVADLPTATTFTVTCGGHTFSTAPVPGKAGRTDPGTAGAPFTIGGAPAPILLVPDRVPAGDSGKIRVTVHYYVVTPATS